MPVEVILPKVDMDMTQGTLSVWHVAEGETVAKGAALFDIETEKAAMEVEAPASGRLHRVTARPGDKVAVGSVIALILAEGESLAEDEMLAASAAKASTLQSVQPIEVILPKVDMDMTHGTIVVWHVAEGDEVAKGAALFDIETDKAAMEVASPASGRLHHIGANPGNKVRVGEIIAYIYPPGLAVGPAPRAAEKPADNVTKTPQPAAAKPAAIMSCSAVGALRATPAARSAARNAGIELATVTGTGPKGRIQCDDVIAAKEQARDPVRLEAVPAIWTAEAGPLNISQRSGTGIPLLMIHGFTADSQSWAPLEKALGPGQALIRIDLPSHGRSPKRRVASFADLARMVVEAFDDATRAFDAVHLLGHSLGGALALAIADIRGTRVASLSLLAPAGLGPEIDAAALAGIVRASRVESLAPWLRRLTATPAGISDDYAKAAMRLRADPALRAAQSDLAEVLFTDGVQCFDLRPALSRLTMPTCLIWGRQDHILPYAQALATPSDAALHLLQGAGHVPHLDKAETVATILARHVRPDLQSAIDGKFRVRQ